MCRAANRRAAKVIRKGTIEEAVAKALQPAYFFVMFEEDVQACTLPVAPVIMPSRFSAPCDGAENLESCCILSSNV